MTLFGSIRVQLRWLGLAPALLMLALLLLALTWQRFADAEQALNGRGQFMSRYIAAASEFGVLSGNPVELQQQAQLALQHDDVRAVRFYDVDDQLLMAQPPDNGMLDSRRHQRVFRAAIYRHAVVVNDAFAASNAQPVPMPEYIGRVEVVLSTAALVDRQREILLATLMPALIAIIAGLLFATHLAERLSRPILLLSELVQRIRAGDYRARGEQQLNSELQVLQEDINRLASELERARQDQQQNMRALEEARQRAEAASQAKSEFLAMMSHELRTPMNGVTGMLQLLNSDALSEQQQEYTHAALDAASHLLDVINDILDFSRVESGRLQLESLDFSLQDLLANSVATFRYLAAQKGLQLTLDMPPLLAAMQVRSDPTRLRQIVSNLLSNAIKFTAHGEVRVLVQADMMRADRLRARLVVEDTGIGIAANNLATLFEAFSQADSSTTRRFGGTGLGLAIARRLTQLLGGTLRVDSELDKGSRFTADFVFVARPAQQAAGEVADKTALSLPLVGRVLLVEDNDVNRMVAERMLSAAGLTVLQATDGEQALGILASEPCDCVLMDLQMPVLDGFATVRRYREYERVQGRSHLPIIALTANVLTGERERCLAAGMDDYLAKPFQREALLRMVQRYI